MIRKLKGTILLVEDDKNLGFVITDFLGISGYKVQHAENGVTGLETFRNGKFDLCILDIMMPFKDGFTLAEEIRHLDKNVPIIFLTAKTMKEDKIRGFKLGADDYITKPFSTEELNLRIEAILRRTRQSLITTDQGIVFNIGKYTFNYSNQVLIGFGHERRLTKKEAEVLRLLCINKNRILRREIALKIIWGEDDYFLGRSMDVFISRLRKYVQNDKNIDIRTVRGTGFILEVLNEN